MLKVLIVAMGQGDSDRERVRHELSLIRSAVLYADEVTLMSAGAELLLGYQQSLSSIAGPEVMHWIIKDPELAARVRDLPDLAETLELIAERIRCADGIWRSEFDELKLGGDRGVLKIVPFTSGPYGSAGATEDGQDGKRFLSNLASILNNPGIHALLDERTATYARELTSRSPGEISEGTRRRARIAAVGAGMIARLPAFPQAPLDELLDLKAEMSTSLTRYRGAVAKLQSVIEADLGDIELDAELDVLWTHTVHPALVALEEGFQEHSLVRELARSVTTSVKGLVTQGAGLYIALSTIGDITTHIAAAASAAGVGLEAVGTAAAANVAAKTSARKDEFYYLYELARRAAAS